MAGPNDVERTMASFHAGLHDQADPQARPAAPVDAGPDEVLSPVIAGAYARGIADALDLFGLPGVFLDRDGEVLFASRAATPLLLDGPLRLHMRHLVADGAADNRLLGDFIADAVGAADGERGVRLPDAALELHRLPRTEASALPGQLVRAVILLADLADPRHAAALTLLT